MFFQFSSFFSTCFRQQELERFFWDGTGWLLLQPVFVDSLILSLFICRTVSLIFIVFRFNCSPAASSVLQKPRCWARSPTWCTRRYSSLIHVESTHLQFNITYLSMSILFVCLLCSALAHLSFDFHSSSPFICIQLAKSTTDSYSYWRRCSMYTCDNTPLLNTPYNPPFLIHTPHAWHTAYALLGLGFK